MATLGPVMLAFRSRLQTAVAWSFIAECIHTAVSQMEIITLPAKEEPAASPVCCFVWEVQSCLSSRKWHFFTWPVLNAVFTVLGLHCIQLWSYLLKCFFALWTQWPPNLPFIWPRLGPAASTFPYRLIGEGEVVLLGPPIWVDWFEIYVTFNLLHPARHTVSGERGLDALQMCAAGV